MNKMKMATKMKRLENKSFLNIYLFSKITKILLIN